MVEVLLRSSGEQTHVATAFTLLPLASGAFTLLPPTLSEAKSWSRRLVLGDRKSLIEIVEIFAKVYGYKPDLHNLGSLEDLHQSMHESLHINPADAMAWVPKWVCPLLSQHDLIMLQSISSKLQQQAHKVNIIKRFFIYWVQNEEARLKRDLDNTNYPHVVPVSFEDFFRRHKFDELASAADNLTFEAWLFRFFLNTRMATVSGKWARRAR